LGYYWSDGTCIKLKCSTKADCAKLYQHSVCLKQVCECKSGFELDHLQLTCVRVGSNQTELNNSAEECQSQSQLKYCQASNVTIVQVSPDRVEDCDGADFWLQMQQLGHALHSNDKYQMLLMLCIILIALVVSLLLVAQFQKQMRQQMAVNAAMKDFNWEMVTKSTDNGGPSTSASKGSAAPKSTSASTSKQTVTSN